jgi:hypothetical protein
MDDQNCQHMHEHLYPPSAHLIYAKRSGSLVRRMRMAWMEVMDIDDDDDD